MIIDSLQYKWMTESFEDLSVIGLPLLAYTCAEAVGGNGFIAAFGAGLIVGAIATNSVLTSLHNFGEAEGQLLTLLSFLMYAAVMVMSSISQASWQMWLYGIICLTVTRMLGVAISVIDLKLQLDSILFIGWFCPRGIASIVYGLLIVNQDNLPGSQLMFMTMIITVLMSVFAHGLTAFPGVCLYAQCIDDKKDLHDFMPEMMPVEEMPVRLPWRR